MTERDRFWLGHHEACVAAGESAKAYAKRRGLSVYALYQSRKRLRTLGVLAPATRRGHRVGARPRERRAGPSFAKVGVLAPAAAASPRYRVRLASGTQLEWEGPAQPAELAALLAMVARLA